MQNEISEEQLKIFRNAFVIANGPVIQFPTTVHVDQVYEIECWTQDMRGCNKVRFFIKRDSQSKWYLELFGSNDDNCWYKRIDANGDISSPGAFQGQFGWPIYSDDPDRTLLEHNKIREHNQRLQDLLIQKGLEPNDDNPDFERDQVIRLTQDPPKD